MSNQSLDSEDDMDLDVSGHGTDDGYYDADEGRNGSDKTSKAKRAASPSVPNISKLDVSQQYTQLKNFAGLSSPLDSFSAGEHNSQKGSMISSLSSMSHDDQHHEQASRRASQETSNSDHTETSENDNSNSTCKLDPNALFKSFSSYFSLTSIMEHKHMQKNNVKISLMDKKENAAVFKNKAYEIQTISFHEGAIWTMKFSPLGGYLCTAGQDSRVIVWSVGKQGNHTEDNQEMSSPIDSKKSTSNSIDFILQKPYRIYEGHTSDVIDLAWSKSNFILSASTDKTVRLWHISRNDCLQYFRHPDIVTAVEFHPAHDRFFISGCFDRRLRLWDIIPDGNVREWAQTPDTITSVCFSPDGQTIVGGLIRGQIYFYEFEGMKYKTQMNCKNRAGKYKNGTKITGVCYRHKKNITTNDTQNRKKWVSLGAQLLITSNDHRIRLCHTDDYSLLCKYKGLRNKSMQIKATFSDDSSNIICGSENGGVYIWNTHPDTSNTTRLFSVGTNRNMSCEYFYNSRNVDIATTVAIFAPSASVFTLIKKDCGDYSNDGNIVAIPQLGEMETMCNDFSTRVIITADCDGLIRVIYRLS